MSSALLRGISPFLDTLRWSICIDQRKGSGDILLLKILNNANTITPAKKKNCSTPKCKGIYSNRSYKSISLFKNSFAPCGPVIDNQILLWLSEIEMLNVKKSQQALSDLMKVTTSSNILSDPSNLYL